LQWLKLPSAWRRLTASRRATTRTGKHDFGSIDYDGNRIFWKIGYYDRASFSTGRDMGSEEPSDPATTLRVFTIMLASEY